MPPRSLTVAAPWLRKLGGARLRPGKAGSAALLGGFAAFRSRTVASVGSVCGKAGGSALLLAVLLVGVAGPVAAIELPQLAALLAQQRNAEATFTEDRFVSGIELPLRSSGTLSFSPPDRFTRTTLQPRQEVMSVDGNRLTLERGGRTRRMALDALPEAGALVDAMRGVLGGDLSALQSRFETRVLGTATRWRLTLRPREQQLFGAVRQLDIEGEGPELRTVEVLLSGGDRSLMTVTPAAGATASAVRR